MTHTPRRISVVTPTDEERREHADVMSPTNLMQSTSQSRLATARGPSPRRNSASPHTTDPAKDTWKPYTMFSRPEPKNRNAKAAGDPTL